MFLLYRVPVAPQTVRVLQKTLLLDGGLSAGETGQTCTQVTRLTYQGRRPLYLPVKSERTQCSVGDMLGDRLSKTCCLTVREKRVRDTHHTHNKWYAPFAWRPLRWSYEPHGNCRLTCSPRTMQPPLSTTGQATHSARTGQPPHGYV